MEFHCGNFRTKGLESAFQNVPTTPGSKKWGTHHCTLRYLCGRQEMRVHLLFHFKQHISRSDVSAKIPSSSCPGMMVVRGRQDFLCFRDGVLFWNVLPAGENAASLVMTAIGTGALPMPSLALNRQAWWRFSDSPLLFPLKKEKKQLLSVAATSELQSVLRINAGSGEYLHPVMTKAALFVSFPRQTWHTSVQRT